MPRLRLGGQLLPETWERDRQLHRVPSPEGGLIARIAHTLRMRFLPVHPMFEPELALRRRVPLRSGRN